MQTLPQPPLALASTPEGLSVVDCPEVTAAAGAAVLRHIASRTGRSFGDLAAAADHVAKHVFEDFKDKPNRTLPQNLAEEFAGSLAAGKFLDRAAGDFVTDEENLGFANVYWRIVRPRSPTDVGPAHADRWFWDLGRWPFPATHARVKVWMPLLQDDAHPSLMVLPGSQNRVFSYGSRLDRFGKAKPVFDDPAVSGSLVPAPVRVGQAIVFHDQLLHGGRSTEVPRISIEWTLACRKP